MIVTVAGVRENDLGCPKQFLSIADSTRADAVLRRLVQHNIDGWGLTGGLAAGLHSVGAGMDGFIAKFGLSTRRGECGLDRSLELRGEAKQFSDKGCLCDRVVLCYPSHASLPDHVYRFDSLQRSPRCPERSVTFR